MLEQTYKDIVLKVDYAFQPIVNIGTGFVVGYEALLRDTDKCGFKTIFQLFDEAFRDGALYALDLELRNKAFEKFGLINDGSFKLFYNLDNRLLLMPDYSFGNTCKIAKKYGIDEEQICFEISERGTLYNPSGISNIINSYKQQGFEIALDDFGTGVSGLKLLYYSEPTYIKLDKFFITDINQDSKKRHFCQTIIDMAHVMGMQVIAEGVENQKEYYICKDIGVDMIQGYFVAYPETNMSLLKFGYEKIQQLYKDDRRGDNIVKITEQHLTWIEPLNLNSTLYDLFVYFRNHPYALFIPIVDEKNRFVGIVEEVDIKQLSYSQYGLALAKNSSINKNIKPYIKKNLCVNIDWGIDKILQTINYDDGDLLGVFVLRDDKYMGFVNIKSLLQLSHLQNIEIAKDQNPLTKLYGNIKIQSFIVDALSVRDEIYHLVYFDFNDFKPFNDKYGFRVGNRAILMFADILKKYKNPNIFIGHIGGDDFFMGFCCYEYEKVFELTSIIMQEFKKIVKTLYIEQDLSNDCICTKDRFGIERKFGLLGVSCAVVEVVKSTGKSFDEEISKLKKYSKASETPLGVSLL